MKLTYGSGIFSLALKMWACKMDMDIFRNKKEDLFEDVDEVITVGDFYKKTKVKACTCCSYK